MDKKSPIEETEPHVEASGVNTDRLMQELGQFKKFHLFNYILLSLVTFTAAHYAINYVFLAADVPYRCVVPECEAPNSTEYSPAWLELAQAPGVRERRCMRRQPQDPQDCGGGFNEELMPCDQWLYASKDTIVAEVSGAVEVLDATAAPRPSGLRRRLDELMPCDQWLYASKDTIVAEVSRAVEVLDATAASRPSGLRWRLPRRADAL
ncbi:hypothetical protein O0L34_g5720 [Tuta absoluta]|nr:hypothetical protein O0L34_g5720 [Tuta absoluta]